jgi:glutaredoxin
VSLMVTVFGTAWCEDTRRALRHLRRLGLAHQFHDIDEDLETLERAVRLSGGGRRTPIIDLGLGGPPLVEPDNDTLTAALVEVEMLTLDDARSRMSAQNVGDLERVGRTMVGVAMLVGAAAAPKRARLPLGVLGTAVALTGIAGWCPVYQRAGLTSLGGPGDRPDEAGRGRWLAAAPSSIEAAAPGAAR